MTDPRAEDRAVGLELQIIDVANDLEWAQAQGRDEDAALHQQRLDGLYTELAAVAEEVEPVEYPAEVHAPHPDEAAGQ